MRVHKCKVERNKFNKTQWLISCPSCRDFWNSTKWEWAIKSAITHRHYYLMSGNNG